MVDEIDRFRAAFFDTVIEIETKKEQEQKRQQLMCAHKYDVLGPMYSEEYQYRTCSKCGHAAVKRIAVWEGTKRCTVQ
jgi:hypothetical protein